MDRGGEQARPGNSGRQDGMGVSEHWIVQEPGGTAPRRVVGTPQMAEHYRDRGWIVDGPFVPGPATPRGAVDREALIDDAVFEINQRWGEPWGDEMRPMDQKLVRETAEAIIDHALRGAVDDA